MIRALIKGSAYSYALILLVFTGCVNPKKLIYLQNKEGNLPAAQHPETFTIPVYTYKIRPKDVLNIQIITYVSSKFSTDKFLPPSDKYVVSDTGTVAFSNIGAVHVAGLTNEEASLRIQQKINEVFDDVYVQVRSLGFTVTLLGEVQQPGTKQVEKDRITIYEAIALAGELSDIADREKVRLIRQSNNGKAQSIYLDLTNDKLLSSPYFFLEPGDIIYVQPVGKLKSRSIASQDATLYLVIVNSLFVIANVINILRPAR
jgi:polysaccharide export outer membrane protein